jgi:hypothetical protein
MIKKFDWKTYISNYEDLINAGINTEKKALWHWKNFGIKEKRTFTSFESGIIDCTYKQCSPTINVKLLMIIACHTNNELKYQTILNNMKYLSIDNIDIILINSKEFEHNYKFDIWKNVIKIFYIENDGYYDFGKWNYVLDNFDYSSYRNVIFTNDSIILTGNINNYFINVANTNWDLYAFNDSRQIKIGYQSYLFSINTSKIQLFKDFYNNSKSKIYNFDDVIKYYELELYHIFNNKFCYYSIGHITAGRNIQFEMDDYYKKILENNTFPIIKIKRILQESIPKFIYEKIPVEIKKCINV